MNAGARNLAWADALVAALVAGGLRHAVLAPGARSAPLAVACLRRAELDCQVISDERAAGFFALGIGKATGRPALVLTTSGTAAANLLPAIVEANLSATPLIVITADRPPETLGWGANQTIDQTKLYGDQVRAFHALPPPDDAVTSDFLGALAARLIETALWPHPGPVHLNAPLREPLLPETLPPPPEVPAPLRLNAPQPAAPDDLAALAARLSARPGVILCGAARYPAGFAEAVTRLAARLDAPLIAEALSNLRFGAHDISRIIAHAAHFLMRAELPAPAWVLRFGAFPVSRVLERWLASLTASEHLLVAPPGAWPDPLWQCGAPLRGDPLTTVEALAEMCRPTSAEFCRTWLQAEAATAASLERHCRDSATLSEGCVARATIDALPDGAQLFIGNSLAMRAVDRYGGKSGKRLTLYGNRGASGIDGNLATAAGIAHATGAPTLALIGDQTLLHDCGSLALAARHDLGIMLLDNGGGGIFAQLPFAAALPPTLLERGFIAPARIDWASLARAFGLRHQRVERGAALAAALRSGFGGMLLEARISRRTAQCATPRRASNISAGAGRSNR